MGSLSEYGRTAGAVHSIGWHLVWCPKYRKRVLVGAVAYACREWEILAMEVMPNHAQLLLSTLLHERMFVVFAILSCVSSQAQHGGRSAVAGLRPQALRSEFAHLRPRLPTLWSNSYFVASVGHVSGATIRRCIDQQTTSPRQERMR
jgi:putative transposase